MFDGRWRTAVDRNTGPVGKTLVRWGVTADVLTASGLVFAVATAVVVGTGHLLIGIPLLALTGFHDLLDGPVAKAGGTASVRGAFFDSVTDRVADAVLMGGVAWYLVSVHKGYEALLPLAVLGAASLVSYERAKAEALGISAAKGGLMERAERMILLGVGFLASWLLVPVLWVLLVLTVLTCAARFVRVWKAADGPVRPVAAAGTDSRWRARRQGRSTRADGRAGQPLARWRARRQEALTSRTGRARRARWSREQRAGSTGSRAGRQSGTRLAARQSGSRPGGRQSDTGRRRS
jgi:phosphatidylinositol phosphate synthase